MNKVIVGEVELNFCDPPVELVECELLAAKRITLKVLRLDQVHCTLQGNKWFKLKYNLLAAMDAGLSRLISFGGAYSNHLYALAAAGSCLGFETVGVVRGEIIEPLNPVLSFCQSQGMTLYPISRQDYRHKAEPGFLQDLVDKLGPAFIIPEGGSNELALKGCEEIAEITSLAASDPKATIAMACGTGATMSGVIRGLNRQQSNHRVLGVSVLKAEGMIERQVQGWLDDGTSKPNVSWHVSDSFHCGGYARADLELTKFLEGFAEISSIPIEPVYTGKLLFGIFSMIEADAFPDGSEIIALHTGGIVSV